MLRLLFLISILGLYSCTNDTKPPSTEVNIEKADSLAQDSLTAALDTVVQNTNTDSLCPCQVSAYITDPDPTINVRDRPKGEIRTKMPTAVGGIATIVQIKAAKDGWVQLASAEDIEKPIEDGWIFGKLAGVNTRNYDGKPIDLYEFSTTESPIVSQIKDMAKEVHIIDCCEDWIYVKGENGDGSAFEGWLMPQQQCPNPVTTCS